MMYSQNFVVAIKVDGRVLREDGDTTYLPFGCEYSILLKNVSSRRAQVKVSIDGTDATQGTWLIVGANQSVELERFISNGNLKRGNRFRFIERTDEIEDHRGIKVDDGLVRVEYKFERETIPVPRYRPREYPYYHYPAVFLGQSNVGAAYTQSWNSSSANSASSSYSVNNASAGPTTGIIGANSMLRSAGLVKSAANDAGITVGGSESNQQFSNCSGFATDPSQVIVLRLKGRGGSEKITTPVTVDHKVRCSSCGRTSKALATFCSNCGTALKLYS